MEQSIPLLKPRIDVIEHDFYQNNMDEQIDESNLSLPISDEHGGNKKIVDEQVLSVDIDHIIDLNAPNDIDMDIVANQQQPNPLSGQQRRKIHNRTCTIKQRKRYYRYTIRINNINKRLTIPRIKSILRAHHIEYVAVNIRQHNLIDENYLSL